MTDRGRRVVQIILGGSVKASSHLELLTWLRRIWNDGPEKKEVENEDDESYT